jgi:hypothetical protein
MLVQSHPVDGYVELFADNDVATLRCHWPIDLKADDWIDIENHYSMFSYLQAVNDSISTGIGGAQGVSGGYLRIISMADGFIIEFSRPQGGWSASALRLRIMRPISDLLPKRMTPEGRSTSTPVMPGGLPGPSAPQGRGPLGGALKKESEGL